MCGFKSGLWTAAQLHYSLLSPKRDASSIPLESLSTPFIVCPPHSTRRVFDMRSKSNCYMTRLIIFCFARREQRPVSVGLSSLRRNRWPSRPWMASWKMTLWSSHMYVGSLVEPVWWRHLGAMNSFYAPPQLFCSSLVMYTLFALSISSLFPLCIGCLNHLDQWTWCVVGGRSTTMPFWIIGHA